MKKILALALTLVMALSLVACGGGKDPAPSGSSTIDPGTSQQEPSNTPDPGTSQQEPASGESTPTSDESGETGLNESIAKWPDNEYTKQIPKPNTGALFSVGDLVDGGWSSNIMQIAEGDFTAYTESCLSGGWSKVD